MPKRRTRTPPAPFLRLTSGLAALAVVAFAGFWKADGTEALADPQLWLLGALAIGMELLPIRLPRGRSTDVVTVSSAFALAALFLFGTFAAMVVWIVASIVADLVARLSPVKIVFNASQYTVCMAAAGLALLATGGEAPLDLTWIALPEMIAAAIAFFVVNHVLAGTGVALLSQARVLPFLVRDLGLLSWTTGFQLALAPLLVGAPGALVVLGAVPVLAIYLGGRQAAQATHDAGHDALTGLANRALLLERVAEAIAHRRPGSRRAWLALIDLDDFKSINDTLGHQCGDVLLRHAATRMREALREGDTLARLGGDEFAVLMPDCGRDGARARARRVLSHLAEPVMLGDLSLRVSASLGLAAADTLAADGEQLLRQADIALYRAKEQGGGIAEFTATDDASGGPAVDRVALAGELSRALDTDQVTVHFQGKVPAAAGLAPAMEALVRWRHPQLGMVDPQAFVAIAEETGMIRRLTARVLDLALERTAVCRRQGSQLRMCVNVSAKSLVDESLPALVADALTRWELPGSALQIEITETACVADVPRSRAVLDELRALGVTLAIDDFGTGFSSLTQLQALDLEEIKIDRSFVMAMEDDPQAAVIVRSVVNLGHSLGLRVCAEGVETPGALEQLRELGCDYVQGYLFGQPSADASPPRPLVVAEVAEAAA